MAPRGFKPKPNDKVMYDNHVVTVLTVKGSKVQIRNRFGYPQDVDKKELSPER